MCPCGIFRRKSHKDEISINIDDIEHTRAETSGVSTDVPAKTHRIKPFQDFGYENVDMEHSPDGMNPNFYINRGFRNSGYESVELPSTEDGGKSNLAPESSQGTTPRAEMLSAYEEVVLSGNEQGSSVVERSTKPRARPCYSQVIKIRPTSRGSKDLEVDGARSSDVSALNELDEHTVIVDNVAYHRYNKDNTPILMKHA